MGLTSLDWAVIGAYLVITEPGNTQAATRMNPQDPRQPELQGGSLGHHQITRAISRQATNEHDGEILGVELPVTVDLLVAQTDPGFAGDTATGAKKAATLETGLVVQVPLFVEPGERIKVDTRTGEYSSRA